MMFPGNAESELIAEASRALTAVQVRGTHFLQDLHDRHKWYPRMLGAFEAIEWHNIAGREAAIHHVATWGPKSCRAFCVRLTCMRSVSVLGSTAQRAPHGSKQSLTSV